ncbi:MerR family transcriptional regulator [Microbispora sp. NPDC049125]|uniref:helix-turn-helix domain-containing protein n=1 Tax=Microbispora sp. NPDC049125 TaxID=3154929 RepID=UPI003465C599
MVPPAGRSAGGYRLYDHDSLDRLELVRTLRDLGVEIAAITRVLADAQTLPRSPTARSRPWRTRSRPCGYARRCCATSPPAVPARPESPA